MNQPKTYSKNNEMQSTDNAFVLENYSYLIKWNSNNNINDNKNLEIILDIGCGEGKTTVEILLPKLPKNFTKLIGCDVSNQMVNFAKEIYDEKYFPRVEFRQFDISCENVKDIIWEQFNHIFSFYCFHWIPEQKRAFENIYKLLKPGGDILLSFLGEMPIFQIYENLSKNNRWASYYRKETISPYHHNKHPDQEVKLLLKDIGFENCFCTVENRQFTFKNFNHLKNAVIAVNPVIATLSPNEKNDYIDEIVKEIKKYFYLNYKIDLFETDKEEKIIAEYKLIIVYANKPEKF